MSAGIGYALGPLTSDQIDFLRIAPLSALVAAANGLVDLNCLAHQELANRGYGQQGIWLGFSGARKAYLSSARHASTSLASVRIPNAVERALK